jgi:hypothetical protein
MVHGYNYGGILQAYATQQILRSHGHEVVTLDYSHSKRKQLLRKLCLNIRGIQDRLQRPIDKLWFFGVDAFEGFRKTHFKFSRPCIGSRDLQEACRGFDAVVVGSDQVWSPEWVDPPYFLDFELAPDCRRVSLAACCGQRSENPEYLAYAAHTLGRFDALSVRNDFTAAMVEQATGRIPDILCDPTLAAELPTTESVPGISGPYILAYLLNLGQSHPLGSEIIQRLKQQAGLPVYSLPLIKRKGTCNLPSDKVIHAISPFQWIHLVANASYFVTDSFHGTLFALKNQRNFTVVSSGYKTIGRIRSILQDVGLEDRVVEGRLEANYAIQDIKAESWQTTIDYLALQQEHYHRFVNRVFGEA